MKNLSSLVNRVQSEADNQDAVVRGTSSSSNLPSIELEEEVIQKGKKDAGLDPEHLEFTTDTFPADGVQEEENDTLRIMNETDDAEEANEEQKNMTLLEALRRYPKAAFWSILVSSTLVMEGYDTALLNSLFALPVFQKTFGSVTKTGSYEITSKWQIGLNMCVFVGEIIGLQLTGFMVEWTGNRRTMITALSFFTVFVFILYYCNSLAMVAVGQILCAMPWGCFQSLAVTYASEVCPLALRYYLTTYSNMCWLFGQLIAAIVMKNSERNFSDSELGYKIPFAIQWVFPVPLALGIYLAPESPWWLVRKSKMEDAKKSLKSILSGSGQEKDIQVNITLEQIKLTIERERIEEKGEGSFRDCFKGVNARRTRISCLTWVAQNSCGSVLLGYSTYFFTRAGLATSKAFTFAIVQFCLGIVGTICSWLASGRIGRWTILAAGLAFQMVTLFVIGALGFSSSSKASYGVGGLLLALSFFYNAGIGAVVYCIVAEIPSAELRTQTIVLARNSYNLMAIFNSILTPYMLNEDDWNWGAKTGLYWGACTAVTLLWVVIDLPETSGRTFSEINELFAQHVPARKFKTTKVDPFRNAPAATDLPNDEQRSLQERQPLVPKT